MRASRTLTLSRKIQARREHRQLFRCGTRSGGSRRVDRRAATYGWRGRSAGLRGLRFRTTRTRDIRSRLRQSTRLRANTNGRDRGVLTPQRRNAKRHKRGNHHLPRRGRTTRLPRATLGCRTRSRAQARAACERRVTLCAELIKNRAKVISLCPRVVEDLAEGFRTRSVRGSKNRMRQSFVLSPRPSLRGAQDANHRPRRPWAGSPLMLRRRVDAEIDSTQVVAHLIGAITKRRCRPLAELSVRVQAPTFHGRVVEDHTAMRT